MTLFLTVVVSGGRIVKSKSAGHKGFLDLGNCLEAVWKGSARRCFHDGFLNGGRQELRLC